MCNNSLMSLAYFPMLCECFWATFWLSPRSLHHLQVNSRSVSHVCSICGVLPVQEGCFSASLHHFQKRKRWETPTKTRGLMQPPLPGAEENFICTWDTSNRLSITNVQPFIRAHPVTWVWSLFPTFFPSFFHFFGGAIDFIIYRWTSANTENAFSKTPGQGWLESTNVRLPRRRFGITT